MQLPSTQMKISILLIVSGILINCHSIHASKPIQEGDMIKVTIMYPNGEDKTFDMDYYRNNHMPMLAELFGSKMIKYEIDQGIGGRTPEDEILFLAIGYLYFHKLTDYQEAFGPNAKQILDDIPNYTNIQPAVQVSQVIR